MFESIGWNHGVAAVLFLTGLWCVWATLRNVRQATRFWNRNWTEAGLFLQQHRRWCIWSLTIRGSIWGSVALMLTSSGLVAALGF